MTTAASDDAQTEAESLGTLRAWSRRRCRRLAIFGGIALASCLAFAVVVNRTSQWKGELLRTGVRTTGSVTAVEPYSTKARGARERVYVAIAPEPKLRVVIDTPLRTYFVRNLLTVWVDPDDPGHARTALHTSRDSLGTELAESGATLTAVAALAAVVGMVYVAFVRVVGRRRHVVVVSARASIPVATGPIDVFRLADTGDDVWKTVLTGGDLCLDGAVVVSDLGRWRLVWAPGSRAPRFCRRPRRGTTLWRRAQAQPT